MNTNRIYNLLHKIVLYPIGPLLILLLLSLSKTETCHAAKDMNMQMPLIGAQVIIEKGQTPQRCV